MGEITNEHLRAISVIEIACSVLSLLGSFFIIFTFCYSKSFHKPINRMVFYASFGNMMSNVGTLMSRGYVNQVTSFGCQFQATLLQLFWPADALWTLAMAINVYLTFYFQFDAKRLRRMEVPYLIVCYGIPLIPAIVFSFIESKKTRVYGNATLWCWISNDWGFLRIAALYAPVWVVNLFTFSIYVRAGRTIYEKHKQLREVHCSETGTLSVCTVKTTEITFTAKAMGNKEIRLSSMNLQQCDARPNTRGPNGAYSVLISSGSDKAAQTKDEIDPVSQETPHSTSMRVVAPPRPANTPRRGNHELSRAALAYTKCSILFFIAMVITWIPSSANRVYSLAHGNKICVPLTFMAAFVLPLQGFWNAIIYIVISWSACLELFEDMKNKGKSIMSKTGTKECGNYKKETGHGYYRSQFKQPTGSSITVMSNKTVELAKGETNSDN